VYNHCVRKAKMEIPVIAVMTVARIIPLIAFSAVGATAADPLVGTWKPNPEKSKLNSGRPDDRRLHHIVKMDAVSSEHYVQTLWSMDGKPLQGADGKALPPTHIFLDGREHVQTDGEPMSFRRIDASHFRGYVRGEKGRTAYDLSVSPDGDTLTMILTGTGSTTGRPIHDVFVYDKR
jgi:hypothetical protein